MAVYQVHEHAELRRYKAPIVSVATLFAFFALLLTWIPPMLIAYRSQGFWPRVLFYYEKPDVHFKYELLVVMDTSTAGDYIAWSTYQNLNELQMNHLRIPLIKTREVDFNDDGRNDVLNFELSMPLVGTEQVYSVRLMLIFDYLLTKYSYFQMESLGYISHSSPVAGAGLQVICDLDLVVDRPLLSYGVDTTYNNSVIDSTSIYAEDFDLGKILFEYSSRNVTTYLADQYPVWVSGRGAEQPFVVNATIHYPMQNSIPIYPGFWTMIKEGWFQYVTLLVLFWYVIKRIKIFVFSNQLVPTIVERPYKDKAS